MNEYELEQILEKRRDEVQKLGLIEKAIEIAVEFDKSPITKQLTSGRVGLYGYRDPNLVINYEQNVSSSDLTDSVNCFLEAFIFFKQLKILEPVLLLKCLLQTFYGHFVAIFQEKGLKHC